MRKIMLLLFLILSVSISVNTAFAAVNFEGGSVEAEGYGTPPVYASGPAQMKSLARLAACADAYRNLLAEIEGVKVDAKTTVENLMVANDTIQLNVHGMLKGAKIIKEEYDPASGYHITMQVQLYGRDSLSEAVMKPWTQMPLQAEDEQSGKPHYTGVIIDCRGFALQPVMSPVIKCIDGEAVYGYRNLDYKKVVEKGMAGYSHAEASLTRAGLHPMVIQAVRVDEGCNPVISSTDAETMLSENRVSGFLENCAVVFERD